MNLILPIDRSSYLKKILELWSEDMEKRIVPYVVVMGEEEHKNDDEDYGLERILNQLEIKYLNNIIYIPNTTFNYSKAVNVALQRVLENYFGSGTGVEPTTTDLDPDPYIVIGNSSTPVTYNRINVDFSRIIDKNNFYMLIPTLINRPDFGSSISNYKSNKFVVGLLRRASWMKDRRYGVPLIALYVKAVKKYGLRFDESKEDEISSKHQFIEKLNSMNFKMYITDKYFLDIDDQKYLEENSSNILLSLHNTIHNTINYYQQHNPSTSAVASQQVVTMKNEETFRFSDNIHIDNDNITIITADGNTAAAGGGAVAESTADMTNICIEKPIEFKLHKDECITTAAPVSNTIITNTIPATTTNGGDGIGFDNTNSTTATFFQKSDDAEKEIFNDQEEEKEDGCCGTITIVDEKNRPNLLFFLNTTIRSLVFCTGILRTLTEDHRYHVDIVVEDKSYYINQYNIIPKKIYRNLYDLNDLHEGRIDKNIYKFKVKDPSFPNKNLKVDVIESQSRDVYHGLLEILCGVLNTTIDPRDYPEPICNFQSPFAQYHSTPNTTTPNVVAGTENLINTDDADGGVMITAAPTKPSYLRNIIPICASIWNKDYSHIHSEAFSTIRTLAMQNPSRDIVLLILRNELPLFSQNSFLFLSNVRFLVDITPLQYLGYGVECNRIITNPYTDGLWLAYGCKGKHGTISCSTSGSSSSNASTAIEIYGSSTQEIRNKYPSIKVKSVRI